jgi:two-component system, LytTR family, response regulator AlgR
MTELLRIAIADDEPLARLRMLHLCEDISEQCPNVVCAQYEHGSALVNAIPSWAQQGAPDVLLLDINMPGLSGVEIAAYVKAHVPTLAIIFVTAEPEHALAAFEVDASDYVLKPVRAERLLLALKKVLKPTAPVAAPNVEHTMLVVHDGGSALSLPLAQVLYFKSDSKVTMVRTLERQYTSTQSLTEIESALSAFPLTTFVRVHRNALLRRTAVGVLHHDPTLEVQVLGVPERLQISRRMLASLRTDLPSTTP